MERTFAWNASGASGSIFSQISAAFLSFVSYLDMIRRIDSSQRSFSSISSSLVVLLKLHSNKVDRRQVPATAKWKRLNCNDPALVAGRR